MNIFKKISLFFTYRSTLKSISKELEIEYGTRVDSIFRMYTVLNIPENVFEEPYNLRKSDIDNIARNYINEFRKNFSSFLVSRGLLELFDVYEVRKVDKYSYLLVFGYSLINTKKFTNNLISTSIVFLVLIFIFVVGLAIFKTFF